jgi:S-adenosylmethionine:tRNA ribosyltransferase-isomerase
VLVSDFNYDLPEELIAQEPLADRAASRLLHVFSSGLKDDQFRNLPDLLKPDDIVVFNNTKVFPARLFGRRSGVRAQLLSPQNPASREFLQGKVEVLLTRQISEVPNDWECLVRPGRKIGVGERLFFGEKDELQAEVLTRGEFGERHIRFAPVADFAGILERIGHVPLPPYIDREDRSSDRERYQTVYARERGSVAAPTAGLHFTPEILGRLKQRNIETAEITLHVGLGTFQPIHVERVEEHRLHKELYEISTDVAGTINRAHAENRRVVAVGTTTIRALEHSAQESGKIQPGRREADIFIYPGYQFRIAGALLTNFHLPQSTLLILVCAFGGQQRILDAYRHAVEQKYRFYSYGDCMLVERLNS